MTSVSRITATPVSVPMVASYRFAFGRMKNFTTTIIEIEDTDGAVGIGESPHGDLSGSEGSTGSGYGEHFRRS